jgi:hypothetical protein
MEIMFWGNLNEEERDRYYFLMNFTKPWLSWASLSKTKKAETIEPTRPTDDDFFEMEMLSMKGWGMIEEIIAGRTNR